MNTQCVLLVYGDSEMDSGSKMRKLRESTGMNRKEFCQFFEIPYRTVTDWELDNRHAPEYVFRLLEYYIRHENLRKKTEKNENISSVFYLLFGSYKSSDFIFKTVQIPHNSKSLTVLSLCSILKISL